MEVLKYRENADSEWKDIIAIKGEKGDKGDKGDTGDKGDPGEKGEGCPESTVFVDSDDGIAITTNGNALLLNLDDSYTRLELSWIAYVWYNSSSATTYHDSKDILISSLPCSVPLATTVFADNALRIVSCRIYLTNTRCTFYDIGQYNLPEGVSNPTFIKITKIVGYK